MRILIVIGFVWKLSESSPAPCRTFAIAEPSVAAGKSDHVIGHLRREPEDNLLSATLHLIEKALRPPLKSFSTDSK